MNSSSDSPKERLQDEPVWVTVKRTCRLVGIGPTTVYKLIGLGKLKTVKIGRRRLIRYSSIINLSG
jgi:excisionase family DNA binding protein